MYLMKITLDLPDDFDHGTLLVLNPLTECDCCGRETKRTVQNMSVTKNLAADGYIVVVSFLCPACDRSY